MRFLRKILLLTIFSLLIMATFSKVNAASANISSNKTSMNVGETATISVSYKAAAWSIQVSGAVSYSSADASSDAKNISKSASLKFTPKKAGTYNVSLSGDVTDENGKTTDVSKTIKITVKEKAITNNTDNNTTTNNTNNNNTSNNTSNDTSKPSTDATLSNLGIKPNDFSGFKKATTSYSVSVPKNVDKISIYATPTNSKAIVTGTGSKNLQIGKNTFNIKVTAEDKKTTKTYTLTITRKDEENSVSDATLINLGIRPKEYDFTGFKSGTTSYSVSVPNDVEKITIYATAKNSKDTISGNGSKSLKVGQNKCEIKVTSEDKKTSKTYVINVTRKEKEEEPEEKPDEKEDETVNNQNDNQDIERGSFAEGLKNLEIKNYNLSPSFSQDVFSYKVDVKEALEALDIDTETTSGNIEVEIAGNENLKPGENIITILVHNKKDDTTSTYQITANVENQEASLTTSNEVSKEAESGSKAKEWIIKGVMLAVIVLIIVLLIKRHKSNEYDDEEYEEDEEDEDYEIEKEEEEDSETEEEARNTNSHLSNESAYNPDSYLSNESTYNPNPGYRSTASEEIRNIGLFDNTQQIEFNEEDRHRRHGKYKGKRFK